MSRNRARNNVIVHPTKKSNEQKRQEAAMKVAKRVRARVNAMKNLKSANMDFLSKLVKEEVAEAQEYDPTRKDFWRLVGKLALEYLVTGKDLLHAEA